MRWLIYEQTHISPIVGVLRFRLLVGRLTASDPDAARERTAVRDALSLLEGHLSDREYFAAGRYTIADIALYGYTHRAHETAWTCSCFPGCATGSSASGASRATSRTSSPMAPTLNSSRAFGRPVLAMGHLPHLQRELSCQNTRPMAGAPWGLTGGV